MIGDTYEAGDCMVLFREQTSEGTVYWRDSGEGPFASSELAFDFADEVAAGAPSLVVQVIWRSTLWVATSAAAHGGGHSEEGKAGQMSLIAGVWTPWADVLCRVCHDALDADVTAKREIKWPEGEKREGDAPGWCTSCGRAIWVQEDIAQLTRLRKLVGSGEMEQTGGMCAALVFPRADGGVVVVTNLDEPLFIGRFATSDWTESPDSLIGEYELPAGTPDEAAVAIIKVVINQEGENR